MNPFHPPALCPPGQSALPPAPGGLASPSLPHAAPRAAQAACERLGSGPARQRPPAPAIWPAVSREGCFQTPSERLATQHCPQHAGTHARAHAHTRTFSHTATSGWFGVTDGSQERVHRSSSLARVQGPRARFRSWSCISCALAWGSAWWACPTPSCFPMFVRGSRSSGSKQRTEPGWRPWVAATPSPPSPLEALPIHAGEASGTSSVCGVPRAKEQKKNPGESWNAGMEKVRPLSCLTDFRSS